MSWLTRLWDRSEHATMELARTSQAAVLGMADYSQRHFPGPTRRAIRATLRLIDNSVEEPAQLVNRPYRLLQSLVALHGEFAQRLLELAEEQDAPPPPAQQPGAGATNVIEMSGFDWGGRPAAAIQTSTISSLPPVERT
jgi:hypothetical protein